MKVKLMMLLKKADEETGDIAQFISDGFIFVAELKNCSAEDFKDDKECDVDLTFFCHKICGVYKNSEEFHEVEKSMNEESYIPMGAFPADPEDKDWRPSPMNYINSTVFEVVDNKKYNAPDNLTLFIGQIGAKHIDQILYYPTSEEKDEIHEGYIVSGIYWIELEILGGK